MKNVTVPTTAPIDILSIVLSAIGFGGFVYGLSGLGEAALHPPAVSPWIPLLTGAVVIAVFVLRQLQLQKQDRALLDLRTLTTKTFTIAMIMMAVLMMSMFGVFILLPIYLQNVLGLSTLQTGLLLLPGGLIMGLCAPTVGRLFDKYGPAPLIIPGAIMLSLVLAGLVFIQQDTPFWMFLIAHIVLSIGLALMFTPLFTVSLGSLPPKLYSHGSAMLGATSTSRRRSRHSVVRRDHDLAGLRSVCRWGQCPCGNDRGHKGCLSLRDDHLVGSDRGRLLHQEAGTRAGASLPPLDKMMRLPCLLVLRMAVLDLEMVIPMPRSVVFARERRGGD